MVTLVIYGIQVDIQAAVVINSRTGVQIAFQHVYFARVASVGSDLNDLYSNVNVKNPCSPNPCNNDGLCTLSVNFTYACVCTAFWGGKNFSKKKIISV